MFLPETIKQAETQDSAWRASTGRLFRCRQACQDRGASRRRLLFASLLALCVGGLLLLESGSVGRLAESPISNPGRVLLVTAHPDDEVIFFSSTITALHASGLEVFLLCLTNGASIIPRTESVYIPKVYGVRKPMSRIGKVCTVGARQALLSAPCRSRSCAQASRGIACVLASLCKQILVKIVNPPRSKE